MARGCCIEVEPGVSIDVDLYNPHSSTGKSRAAIVFLHGGGFVGGSRDQFLAAACFLALTENVFGVTVSYRTAPRSRFPAPVEDCRAVCDWLYSHRDECLIDPEQVVFVGGSPGANIAAMTMLTAPARPSLPRRAVLLNGIMDMADFYDRNPDERDNIHQYLGVTHRDAGMLKKASPFAHVKPGLDVLFLHGAEDRIVPIEQSRNMAGALERKGSRGRVIPFPGEGHAWFNHPEKQYAVLAAMASFLRR